MSRIPKYDSTVLRAQFFEYQSTEDYFNETTSVHTRLIDSSGGVSSISGIEGLVGWLECCIDNFDKCDGDIFQKFLNQLVEILSNTGVRTIDFKRHFDQIVTRFSEKRKHINN